jgi:arylsulfatase
MSGMTPNLNKLASQGMRFTDYHTEASITAGHANFMTVEWPIRPGLTAAHKGGEPTWGCQTRPSSLPLPQKGAGIRNRPVGERTIAET